MSPRGSPRREIKSLPPPMAQTPLKKETPVAAIIETRSERKTLNHVFFNIFYFPMFSCFLISITNRQPCEDQNKEIRDFLSAENCKKMERENNSNSTLLSKNQLSLIWMMVGMVTRELPDLVFPFCQPNTILPLSKLN